MYNIDIELAFSDLEIVTSTVQEINVHIKKSRNGDLIPLPPSIDIQEDETGLIIKESFGDNGFTLKEFGKFLTGENRSVYLYIEIPQDFVIEHALIVLKTGDLRLNGITCNTVEIKALAGDVKGKDVVIESIQATLAAGDIKLFGEIEEIHLDLKAGDIKLSPSVNVESININSAVGDVKLELPNVSDYAVFSSLSLGELKFKRFESPVTLNPESEKKIFVKSKVGDFKIYKSF
ncbi:DUF4097 family beta strand repeat-containing protein [Fusibacter tunisiensis]|uniref:DUF4097 domain-containing protein n=1 Tax=Fusibacter tunisiensis TaxID=1008308 RepID=A0ABS2MP27_9FIRM|nr:DUF4097 family beta strand repeat-containing protein [Fusibacter tunisiensis]MBM7561147.1 hypothetical protein [Fusibacter tunisiensis]